SRIAVCSCNDKWNRCRGLHRLRVLHLQLNRSGGGNAGGSNRARQGIAVNRRRGEWRTIPEDGGLGREVGSHNLQSWSCGSSCNGLREYLSNGWDSNRLLCRGLRRCARCTAKTIKKERETYTRCDCL